MKPVKMCRTCLKRRPRRLRFRLLRSDQVAEARIATDQIEFCSQYCAALFAFKLCADPVANDYVIHWCEVHGWQGHEDDGCVECAEEED